MKHKILAVPLNYDGSQLRSLYGYLDHGILGNSVIVGKGTCDITFEHMVDGEDLLAQASIFSEEMLHFIIEVFDQKLFSGVCLQRLFSGIVCDQLNKTLRKNSLEQNQNNAQYGSVIIFREGDDLYDSADVKNRNKLSISIATASPVSTLIHFGINISSKNTPVPTRGLADYGISPIGFAEQVATTLCAEFNSIVEATQKVRWVK